jgi:hypothetical protein
LFGIRPEGMVSLASLPQAVYLAAALAGILITVALTIRRYRGITA